MTWLINSYFSTFDKLEDLVKSYKERRGGLCCKLVSNFVDPPDDYGPVIDYEGQGSTHHNQLLLAPHQKILLSQDRPVRDP